jgi:Tfp pilus assembly protein PilF
MPASARLIPGERITILGREFQMRPAPKSLPRIVARWGGLGILSLLALFGLVYLFGGTSGGTISGVVVDRITGRIITSATVDVMNGPIVKTNAAGLYAVNDLPPGQYQIAASGLGYEPQIGTVTRTDEKHAQLAFALMPLVIDSSELAGGGSAGKSNETATSEPDRPKIAFGHVLLEVDFDGYLVFVDNVLYGKNTDKVKRLTSGKHVITLQLEGFEDHSTTVNVKARATETLQIAKADLTPKHNPVKRAKKHFATAKEHLDQSEWLAAIAAYDRGLEFNPDDATALQYRGWAHMKIGNTGKARDDLTRAAQFHAASNRYLDAVACAGYLIEIDPKSPDGYRRRAEFYVTLTEYEKAIKDYETAIKRDKKSARLRLGLAETYFVAGEYKDAAKEFDRARKLVEDPTDIYVQMLIALTRAGDDGRVRHKYKELTEFADPDRLQELRKNPEWLRVLQIVDPMERSEG